VPTTRLRAPGNIAPERLAAFQASAPALSIRQDLDGSDNAVDRYRGY